jgi:hypothetical protein
LVLQQGRGIKSKVITFPNHKTARVVEASANVAARDIINALNIKPPNAMILIFGGAANNLEPSSNSYLEQIFAYIAQLAADIDGLIIDGGTESGVMKLMGQKVAQIQSNPPQILGIAPMGKVTSPEGEVKEIADDTASLEPNHSHFVLIQGNRWGDETDKMFEIIGALPDEPIQTVVILAGGGEISKKEILHSVRHGLPIIVIENTGKLADEIASYKKRQKPSKITDDIVMKEIASYAAIKLFPVNRVLYEFKRTLVDSLNHDPLLELAWKNFALYDNHAIRLQDNFNKFQILILSLGVVATALALSQTQFKPFLDVNPIFNGLLGYVLIVLPITISVMIAASNRFRLGTKWVLLRASAEAIKSEMYHYRTRAHLYRRGSGNDSQESPRQKFSSRIRYINNQLMKTEVSLHGFKKYEGEIPPKMYGAAADDDGYSMLTTDKYIKIRIGDQLSYYQKKIPKLERQLRYLQWTILIMGGIGTFLAAAGLQLWVALTIALAGMFAAFLEYRQVENTVIKYNQTATELSNVEAWWQSLTLSEKVDTNNIDRLVKQTEEALSTELTGWVKQMQDTIDKLYTKKEDTKASTDTPAQGSQ